MSEIINKAKEFFNKRVIDCSSDPYKLLSHVPEVEKWARFLLKKHPEADEEVVLLGVWLHDIGHYPVSEIDNAIKGEDSAREFLIKNNYNNEKLKKAVHIVRSHRCRDVMPETIEAKIVAFSDSASHMTDTMYLDMIRQGKLKKDVLGKIERDFRDLSYFPEIK